MTQQHPALALARLQTESGNPQGALAIIDQALKQEPLDRHLLHARAHANIVLQNISQAEKDLDSIVSLFANDAEAWDDRGVLFQWRGDYFRAAECHMKSVDIIQSEGNILNLAIALDHLGQKSQARNLYELVLQINENNTRAITNLAIIIDESGNTETAELLLKNAVELGDKTFETCMAYGNLCRKAGRIDEATSWYEQAVAQRPSNKSAQFLLATMKGDNPEAPPAEHVAELFDNYADHFETSLRNDLKYRVPELLFAAAEKEIAALKNKNGDLTVIDLGAGTGLLGTLLRPHVKTSIGLDLSAKMLQKAQEKNIYNSVVCQDIVTGLETFPAGHFDIVTAADVLVYLGKLDETFDAVSKVLKKDGVFVFSTEALDEGASDYQVRDTGRYGHKETYLKKLATDKGFLIVTFERDWIRHNKEKPLDGYIAVLKKI